jgi:hypothetical protein
LTCRTIRKTIDLLIGTWCIENRRPLLHNDSGFHPMARHLGLIEVPATAERRGSRPTMSTSRRMHRLQAHRGTHRRIRG